MGFGKLEVQEFFHGAHGPLLGFYPAFSIIAEEFGGRGVFQFVPILPDQNLGLPYI